MSSDRYLTPEGFDLPKPLLLPSVLDFAELFEYIREWDHSTMTAGPREVDRKLVPPSIYVDQMEIGPFMSAKLSTGRRSLAVRSTPLTVEALVQAWGEGRIGFGLFEHAQNGRVLVTAEHSQMTRSQYLAYIDPATIPPASCA